MTAPDSGRTLPSKDAQQIWRAGVMRKAAEFVRNLDAVGILHKHTDQATQVKVLGVFAADVFGVPLRADYDPNADYTSYSITVSHPSGVLRRVNLGPWGLDGRLYAASFGNVNPEGRFHDTLALPAAPLTRIAEGLTE